MCSSVLRPQQEKKLAAAVGPHFLPAVAAVDLLQSGSDGNHGDGPGP